MPLPHVAPFAKNPLYFFTACAARRRRRLAAAEPVAILEEIWRASAALNGWWVGRYVVMPDHVHFFARPAVEAKTRAAWCATWKSISAHRMVRELGWAPPVWQTDTFDHILRAAESYSEKWEYVVNNPVRAGLVPRAEDWPWQGEIHRVAF